MSVIAVLARHNLLATRQTLVEINKPLKVMANGHLHVVVASREFSIDNIIIVPLLFKFKLSFISS